MLNLVWVKTFLALVQNHSFQLAADQLGIAQPTVSQHIQKLEERLDLVLFNRGAGCKPTREALVFLPYAQSLIRLNDRALAALQGDHLRLGASSNIGIYLLPPLLKDYLQGRPPSAVDLLIEGNPAIADKLDSGEVDIALMEWWDDRPGFAVRCWKREPLVLIVPPQHPWAQRTSLSRDELGTTELLGGEPGTGTGRLLRSYFADTPLPRSTYQLGSTEAVKQSVRAGLGISLVMASAVEEEVAFGSLRAIPLTDPPLHKHLYMVWREDGSRRQAPPAFVAHLNQVMTDLGGASQGLFDGANAHFQSVNPG